MIMRKYRYFSTIDREEDWLNAQLDKGLVLCEPVGFGRYSFELKSQSDQVVRIDSRKFKTEDEKNDYFQFMADFGWKNVKNESKNDGKIYFIGESSISDELFSDSNSKYEREVRSRNSLFSMNMFIFIFYMLIFYNKTNKSIFFNPKAAFLTPGLWYKGDQEFWSAFLFELPFAILRIIFAFAPLILLGYFIYQFILVQKSINKYKHSN